MLLVKHLVAEAFVERVQVGALQVLDELDLEDLLVGQLAHEARHLEQARGLRRAEPPGAGDDLEVRADAHALVLDFGHLAHEQGLQDAVRLQAVDELAVRLLAEGSPRVRGRLSQLVQVQEGHAVVGVSDRCGRGLVDGRHGCVLLLRMKRRRSAVA